MFPIWVDDFVYERLKEHGHYEDLYVVPIDTYKDTPQCLKVKVDNKGELSSTGLCCMRGSKLGQRRVDWGAFGFARNKYQYEYNVANKIALRMEYLHSKTGQTVFHIPIKDRWKNNVGHHHLTTKTFLNALSPVLDGYETLVVDDWRNGLMSFMFVKEVKNKECLQTAHRLFEEAHKQYLVDKVKGDGHDNYPHI